MTVTPATNRLIWVRSAGLCAICRKKLVEDETAADAAAMFGKVGHIVSQSDRGPRSDQPVPGGDRDGPANLLLLCPEHHDIIDTQPATYPVERLVGIKEAHEQWVLERLGAEEANSDPGPLLIEAVHSSVMAVDRMPLHVYAAPCDLRESDVRPRIRSPEGKGIALPYIVREKKLITFARLTDASHPFTDAIAEPAGAERHSAADWWRDKDLSNWYLALLNRTLNKLTGRRGLNLDKEHNRYYFDPLRGENDEPLPREVEYRPLNMKTSTRSVVWQPTRKKTGEARSYWTHLAVRLRFQRVTDTAWVLAIRPELRFTVDGFQPLVPKATGRRATRAKSHLYNYDLLGELQFWKEYLSDGKPNIIVDFGGQSLVIDARLLSGQAEWPGVPGDEKPFANRTTEHDLFTISEYARALEADRDPEADIEGWELDHLAELEELASEES